MADFRTHVTFSSAIGAGYAVIASTRFDIDTALVAGGLCGVSGMLPDVDSDSGVPRREALGFAAAIVPMLLLSRLREMNLGHDTIILIAAGMYFGIRFVAADLIGRWSVHRGMWHSIPAILIFAGLAFLISSPTNVFDRYLKAVAVGLGAFSHLILDEIYSVDTRGVVPKFKKSFGTAVKFWGKKGWANFTTYAKLAAVGLAILADGMVLERLEMYDSEHASVLREIGKQASEGVQSAKERLALLPNQQNQSSAPPSPAPQSAPAQPRPATPTPPREPVPTPRTPPPFAVPSRPVSPWFAPPTSQPSGGFAPNRSDTPPRY